MNTKPQFDLIAEDLETLTHFISHDIRSPIRSLIGFGDLLANESAQLNPSAAAHAKRISNIAHRLQILTDGMLTYIRLGQRTLIETDIDFTKICHEVIESKKKQYPKVSIEAMIAPNLSCHGDETLILTFLENLIDNSIQFSQNNATKITIDSMITEKGFTFRIHDNGLGFEMGHANYLFSPFELLHTEQGLGGIGMGLAIAKRIIDRHNGLMWFESKPHVGSTFYFQIHP